MVARNKRRTWGLGRIYQPIYRDKKSGESKTSSIWWIEYHVRGTPYRESSKSRNSADANRLLKQRLGGAATGAAVGRDVSRTTVSELLDLVVHDHINNERKNLRQIETTIVARLKDEFGDVKAIDFRVDDIDAYKSRQRAEGYANATINRYLATLRRGFRLGLKAGKILTVPSFVLLKEDNVRKGFFERDAFEELLKHVPAHFRPLFEVAYITGWRVTSEILTRQWTHVDFSGAGWLRIEPGEGKSGVGRMFPFTSQLRDALEAQRAWVKSLEAKLASIIPWVFPQEDGTPILSYRAVWDRARKTSGINRLVHDFRRTAVRNLERAGVPQATAMQMVGHKTASVYRRYAIVEESALKDAALKLGRLMEEQAAQPSKLARLPTRH